ncbi:MAG: D-alanyl-D-alanine carboxypeptidase/D-alanyl-D-alanine-endopeptidase [Methylophilus sp.]|nr:D-alanyl-D-alanine carboxypeptidase/D-alanyl-D-alanine-endopeptidase [Methylophilus sp.]
MKYLMTCLVFSVSSLLAHAGLPVAVDEALKSAGIPQENVAIYVQAVDANVPTLSLNTDKPMNPASVMKLVTTYAALEKLTPAYRWKTEVYRDGEVRHGVLHGNLIIKGYGDPHFQAQDFWRLLMRLQQLGIHSIQGNLIIDKTYFSVPPIEAPFDDEVWRAYHAKPSAFLVAGRKTSLQFEVVEGKVVVNQEFTLPEVNIISTLQVREGECGDWRGLMDYAVTPQKNSVQVRLKGTYSAQCETRYLELSLFNDEMYAFLTFKKLWSELGGKFKGKLAVQAMPENATKLFEQHSAPLGESIRDINKWSNNVMARQLLLTLAAEDNPWLATEAHGAEVIKQQLIQLQLPHDGLVIENGSGLSRIERIGAAQLGRMLVKAFHRPVMPELLASLPVLGLDGTAKNRLQDSLAIAQGHIKTGSINGVSAIAGYMLDLQHRRYAVVMLVNHPKASQARQAQDKLIEWVYQH